MGRIVIALFAVALLGCTAYLCLWPVPIDPVAWTPPPAPKLEGPFAVNDTLARSRHLLEDLGIGPEDIAFDREGRLYTGFDDGQIVRTMLPDGKPEVFARTGGRPLGMVFDGTGSLIVADAVKGLLSISPRGVMTVLATGIGGVPFGFLDDLDIGPDGTIYFSDASAKFRFGPDANLIDLLEHGGHGRLLARDPRDGSIRTLLDGLQFANGVVADPSGAFVLVAETGAYRITRHWLTGDRAGRSDVFADNLPGFPDNISRAPDGCIWVPLPAPRAAALDRLGPWPFLRKVVLRLPAALSPEPAPYGLAVELSPDGHPIRALHDPSGRVADRTSAMERDGVLYLGTYIQRFVVAVPLARR